MCKSSERLENVSTWSSVYIYCKQLQAKESYTAMWASLLSVACLCLGVQFYFVVCFSPEVHAAALAASEATPQ